MKHQRIINWTSRVAVLVALTNGAAAQYQLEDAAVVAYDAAAGDLFGGDLALRGDQMIVGARLADSQLLNDTGAAYVFQRSGNGWEQSGKLVANPVTQGDAFGGTVEVGGGYAFVGAWAGGPSSQGLVHVYRDEGKYWTSAGTLTSSFLATADGFGYAMDLSAQGTELVVGSPWGDGVLPSTGIATLFYRTPNGFQESFHLFASDGQHVEAFGSAVAIDGDTVMVGAYKEFNPLGMFGAVYVFERSAGQWVQTQKLQSSDSTHSDTFGWSVDLAGDLAIIGAPERNGREGGAYTFVRTPTGWVEEQIIEGWAITQQEQFGTTVALSWPYAIVGAQESAYFLERLPTGWEIRDALVASDYQPGTGFGRSVCADGGVAVVAAPSSMQLGAPSGITYVFALDPLVTNYCVADANSTGMPATMAAGGSASLSANNLELIAGAIGPNQPGIFFYGQQETEVPFGNGNRCIAGRLHMAHPLSRAGEDGYLRTSFDNSLNSLISAGATWKFQAWYRDPAAGGHGFDLSDGMSVFIGP
jgi:hypothetical protein